MVSYVSEREAQPCKCEAQPCKCEAQPCKCEAQPCKCGAQPRKREAQPYRREAQTQTPKPSAGVHQKVPKTSLNHPNTEKLNFVLF